MTSAKRGFTLIELLIVIVIIGILAAIAIPKYAASKEKAYVARMINDLRNLAVSQEAYFNDNATYYSGSIPAADMIYSPSQGVSMTIDAGTASGWSATASSVGTTRVCQVFYGSAAPDGVATVEGRVACSPSS
ncbi:MAG TPA: prepilin-type N-terminal cleavage/methylation domain-containing protein [Gemmatimonadales bacterium]|nr:prepilin-type N-terminal cleavage/methylation domain-containing protein [Gemmatimonadales bacterium]